MNRPLYTGNVLAGHSERTFDTSHREAALIGYEQIKREVEEKIASIRNRLGSGGTAALQ